MYKENFLWLKTVAFTWNWKQTTSLLIGLNWRHIQRKSSKKIFLSNCHVLANPINPKNSWYCNPKELLKILHLPMCFWYCKFMKTTTRKEKLQIHLLALHTKNYRRKDVSHLSDSIINHMARWELQVIGSKLKQAYEHDHCKIQLRIFNFLGFMGLS
jgi:hypothetical protein